MPTELARVTRIAQEFDLLSPASRAWLYSQLGSSSTFPRRTKASKKVATPAKVSRKRSVKAGPCPECGSKDFTHSKVALGIHRRRAHGVKGGVAPEK